MLSVGVLWFAVLFALLGLRFSIVCVSVVAYLFYDSWCLVGMLCFRCLVAFSWRLFCFGCFGLLFIVGLGGFGVGIAVVCFVLMCL